MHENDSLRAAPKDHLATLRRSGLLDTASDDRFSRFTGFVQDMLDVPVSVISLIDEDRQVFLGHCGLPQPWDEKGETPLSHSFCQHVVDRGAVLSVEDARKDPLVKDNLAIADLGVKAYLGVPLYLPTGELVGALAAIDTKPRPWTSLDLRRLESISRMVEQEIAGRLSETRWRVLFEQLQEGFIMGKVIRDEAGKIFDWRYEEVNKAWGDLVGMSPDAVIGRTVRQISHAVEDDWILELAEVVDTRTGKGFTRQVETLNKWYDGFAQWTGGDKFVVRFTDVTERVKAENERTASRRHLQSVLDRVPVGVMLAEAPSGKVVAVNDYLLRMIGRDSSAATGLDDYDMFEAYHADGQRVQIAEYPLARIVTGEVDEDDLDVHYQRPDGTRLWMSISGAAIKDDRGQTTGAIIAVVNIEDRKREEAEQTVLNFELAHRLKNTLAVVQSIATQTLRSASDLPSAQQSLTNRIMTLSRAHDILLVGQNDTGPIEEIIRRATDVHDPDGRIAISGSNVTVGAKAALSLALIMHELATNAGKYGALSVPEGRVDVRWRIEKSEDSQKLALEWVESGGPVVTAPSSTGFGTRLIEMGLPGADGSAVDLDFAPEGLRCRIVSSLAEVQETTLPKRR